MTVVIYISAAGGIAAKDSEIQRLAQSRFRMYEVEWREISMGVYELSGPIQRLCALCFCLGADGIYNVGTA